MAIFTAGSASKKKADSDPSLCYDGTGDTSKDRNFYRPGTNLYNPAVFSLYRHDGKFKMNDSH